jgi:hypothetical protein
MVADDAKHLLEVRGIGGPDPEDAVSFASHGICLRNLGNGAHHFPHSVWRNPSFAIDLDKCLDCPTQCRWLDLGSEAPDDTAEPEAIDPSFGRRGGQSDVVAEHGEALSAMVGKARKDLVINLVKTQQTRLLSSITLSELRPCGL